MIRFGLVALVLALIISCAEKKSFDVVIRGGTIYDGSGGDPVVADIGINSDTIAAIGDLSNAVGKSEIDAKGLSVAPGFINMLSWATESLIVDGKSQGDIRQGVTLEVFGEGMSMGPLNEEMKKGMRSQMHDYSFEISMDNIRRIPGSYGKERHLL